MAAAAGLAVLPRETRLLIGVRGTRPARRARDRTQLGLARDPAPDLPASFRRAACRSGDRAARPRSGRRQPSPRSSSRSSRWAWDKTPELFNWEPAVRQEARADAAAYLAATSSPERRPLRLRPALHPGLGAQRRLPARDAAARGRRSRPPQPPRPQAAPRPRRLGLRRQQDDELRALAANPTQVTAARVGLRGARLRAVPRDPDARAGRHAGPVPPPGGAGDAGREAALPRRRRHQPADDRTRCSGTTRLRRRRARSRRARGSTGPPRTQRALPGSHACAPSGATGARRRLPPTHRPPHRPGRNVLAGAAAGAPRPWDDGTR